MQYKAICFDIDGTLYPVPFLNRVVAKIAFFHPFVSKTYRELRLEIRRIQDADDPELRNLDFRSKEALVYGRVTGQKKDVQKLREELDCKYYRHLKHGYEKIGPMEETRRTLEKIRQSGLKIGVFSDWPLFDKLERMQLIDLCDVVSNSDLGGYLKPSVHAFDDMLNRLEVNPHDILYVGDSYSKDVQGAGLAGMDAVLVNSDGNACDYPEAVKVCRNWKEFDSFIDSVLEDGKCRQVH